MATHAAMLGMALLAFRAGTDRWGDLSTAVARNHVPRFSGWMRKRSKRLRNGGLVPVCGVENRCRCSWRWKSRSCCD